MDYWAKVFSFDTYILQINNTTPSCTNQDINIVIQTTQVFQAVYF